MDRLQAPDSRPEVRIARVQHHLGAQLVQRVVLVHAGDRDDLGAGSACELDSIGPDPAAGPDDEDPRSAARGQASDDHLVGRAGSKRDCCRLDEAQAWRAAGDDAGVHLWYSA